MGPYSDTFSASFRRLLQAAQHDITLCFIAVKEDFTLAGVVQKQPIDNCRILDSVNLDAVLTTPNTWTARTLGVSENSTVPVRCTWISTANNLQIKGDLARRMIWIHLDAECEKPYERGGFLHENLREWIISNRSAIVAACLTLVRAWIEAGQPAYKGTAKKGSYENWLSVMGGILETVGISDFLGNAQEAEAQIDMQIDTWRGFLHQWYALGPDKRKASASELALIASEFFPDELADERTRNQKMGYLLRSNIDRIFGNYRLRRMKDEHKSARYGVEEVKKA